MSKEKNIIKLAAKKKEKEKTDNKEYKKVIDETFNDLKKKLLKGNIDAICIVYIDEYNETEVCLINDEPSREIVGLLDEGKDIVKSWYQDGDIEFEEE